MSDALDRLIALAESTADSGDAVPAPAWALREVLAEMRHIAKDLRECRDHLSNLVSAYGPPERKAADLKAAADWLANWDDERADPNPFEEDP